MGAMGVMGVPGAMGVAGATGPAGTAGATGPAGPSGPPGINAGTTPSAQVQFVGYAPSHTANLGGRTGAHTICDAAFAGSHFCVNWELDQANAAPPTDTAWVDAGSSAMSSRYFRDSYSTRDVDTCAGWTDPSPTNKADGVNLNRGQVYTNLGGFASTFVSNTDGGCGTPRPVACCAGGTGVRFRGVTAAKTGNLGGRTGANAVCSATYSGSHFCTSWEVDQSAAHPLPASGVWVEPGSSDTTQRSYHQSYSNRDVDTCGGWTDAAAADKADGVNTNRGYVITQLGQFTSSFVATNDGGCENARPLACCDGIPPQ